MSLTEKAKFLKAVTVLIDTREKENSHIIERLDALGIAHESKKLDFGDYSFCVAGRDFSLSSVVERKANVDELYSNIMEGTANHRGERIEKELEAGCKTCNQFVLLIEGCTDMIALRDYVVPEWKMKMSPSRVVSEIGKDVYARIKAWQASNRYDFRVEFSASKQDTAAKIVEEFYYYYHNYKILIGARK